MVGVAPHGHRGRVIAHHGDDDLGILRGLAGRQGLPGTCSHQGLGWIPGTVRQLAPAGDVRVPHMGWNDVIPIAGHPLIERGEAYFLHSFAFDGDNVLATTAHGGPVTAAIGRDNLAGVQFHPEKSQRYGIALLQRFLAWRP